MTPSLLLVFAHPDDETYATGATVAHYARRSQGQHRESFERYAITDSESFSVAVGQPAPSGTTDLFAGLLLEQRLDRGGER